MRYFKIISFVRKIFPSTRFTYNKHVGERIIYSYRLNERQKDKINELIFMGWVESITFQRIERSIACRTPPCFFLLRQHYRNSSIDYAETIIIKILVSITRAFLNMRIPGPPLPELLYLRGIIMCGIIVTRVVLNSPELQILYIHPNTQLIIAAKSLSLEQITI